MDILRLGAEQLAQTLGNDTSLQTMKLALSELLGDGRGNLNLSGVADKMMSSKDLAGVAKSWLGNGDNKHISTEDIVLLLGVAKVARFANRAGVDTGAAARGLADVLPRMIDTASGGTSLLQCTDASRGFVELMKKFF